MCPNFYGGYFGKCKGGNSDENRVYNLALDQTSCSLFGMSYGISYYVNRPTTTENTQHNIVNSWAEWSDDMTTLNLISEWDENGKKCANMRYSMERMQRVKRQKFWVMGRKQKFQNVSIKSTKSQSNTPLLNRNSKGGQPRLLHPIAKRKFISENIINP